jgi:hypothetical protein
MKVLSGRAARITRRILWSIVAILMAFLIFTFGGSLILTYIETECNTTHLFIINENIYQCNPVHLQLPQKDGFDS